MKSGDSVGSRKVKDMQRRTWYKFDVGEENKNPLGLASSTRYRRNVQVSMRTDDVTLLGITKEPLRLFGDGIHLCRESYRLVWCVMVNLKKY